MAAGFLFSEGRGELYLYLLLPTKKGNRAISIGAKGLACYFYFKVLGQLSVKDDLGIFVYGPSPPRLDVGKANNIKKAIGLLLTLMADRGLWGKWGPGVFGAYLGLVMADFLLDAGVWRLREKFQGDYIRSRMGFIFSK